MDPRDTAEQAKFRSEVSSFLDANLPPFRDAFENEPSSENKLKISAEWQGVLFDSGYGAIGWPEQFGGVPGTEVQKFIVGEECAQAGAPWHLNMSVTLGWCAPAIRDFGTDAQKQKHLSKMLRGEEVWCQLFSEPNAGSDLASLTTSAIKTGDTYTVNGQKIWSSGAHWSKYGVLVARHDPTGPRYSNLSYFICDMSNPGVEVRPITQLTGEQDFCEVFFSDAQIPVTDLVAEEGMGWTVAVSTLLNERIGLASGGMTRMFNSVWGGLVELLKANPDDRVLQRKVGELYTRMVCNRWTVLRTLDAVFKGSAPGPEASILKLGSDAWMQDAQQTAYETLGMHGHLDADKRGVHEGRWAKAHLYSLAFTIGGGTTEVQKNIVGERVLGLPKEPRA